MLENKLFILYCSYWGKRNCFLRLLFRNTFFLENSFGWFLFDWPLILLLWNFFIKLINHKVWSSVDFQVFKIEAVNQLLSRQFQSFFCDFDELLVVLDNILNKDFKLWIHFFWIGIRLVWHFLDDANDFGKHVRSGFFHEGHEILDFLLLRFINDHLVSFFHEKVEFISKFAVIEKGMINFNEAIVFVLCFLVFSEELCHVFISLKILIFEFFKPFFGLFDANLFHRGKWMKLQIIRVNFNLYKMDEWISKWDSRQNWFKEIKIKKMLLFDL